MVYLGIVAGIFWTEFIIKTFVEKKGKIGVTKSVCGGKILLKKYHNKGFALDIGQQKQRAVAFASLVLTVMISFVALLGSKRWNKRIKTGLSFVLGGAYSNTYDRLARNYVVDYISLGVKNRRLRRIVFNVADFCIMIGSILVVIGGIKHENISKRQICGKGDGGFGGPQ